MEVLNQTAGPYDFNTENIRRINTQMYSEIINLCMWKDNAKENIKIA